MSPNNTPEMSPALHIALRGEHVLLSSVTLDSTSGLVVAALMTVVVCLVERYAAIILGIAVLRRVQGADLCGLETLDAMPYTSPVSDIPGAMESNAFLARHHIPIVSSRMPLCCISTDLCVDQGIHARSYDSTHRVC